MDDGSGKGSGGYPPVLLSRERKITVAAIFVQPFFMLKIQCSFSKEWKAVFSLKRRNTFGGLKGQNESSKGIWFCHAE